MIELKNISKSFGAVRALKSVSLELRQGQILALVGENGAGKSTLMKILSGVYPAGDYQGQILINGELLQLRSPKQADQFGIALIHQELSCFTHLTVAENMAVGHWPTKGSILDDRKILDDGQKWLDILGADFLCTAMMENLSAGQRQLVEIAKALSRQSKYIIFDEPTSSLTSKETKKLFELIRNLKSKTCGVIYI